MADETPQPTYLVTSREMGGAERGIVRLVNELAGDFDVVIGGLRSGIE